MKKIIYLIIFIAIVSSFAMFIVKRKQIEKPIVNNEKVTEINKNVVKSKEDNSKLQEQEATTKTTKKEESEKKVKPKPTEFKYATAEQTVLAKKIRTDIDAKDFESFATDLRKVYDKGWQKIDGFKALESELYVYVTDNYYRKGKYNESLRLANIVFDKVFESWRFTYMKIVSLKGLGELALQKGDYDLADQYAKDILAIEFRPEGVDLHAQAMIAKSKQAQKTGNIKEAKALLSELLDYQLTVARRTEVQKLLTELK